MTLHEKDRDEVIKYRTDQAYEAVEDVSFLLEHNKLKLAVNRIYYGMFYMVSALAVKHQFKTSRHQQLLGWFNREFIKTGQIPVKFGKIFREAYSRRTDVDYGDIKEYAREDVEAWYRQMKEFIIQVEKHLL
jgi:uncharacterized protein (UPF0332 family)